MSEYASSPVIITATIEQRPPARPGGCRCQQRVTDGLQRGVYMQRGTKCCLQQQYAAMLPSLRMLARMPRQRRCRAAPLRCCRSAAARASRRYAHAAAEGSNMRAMRCYRGCCAAAAARGARYAWYARKAVATSHGARRSPLPHMRAAARSVGSVMRSSAACALQGTGQNRHTMEYHHHG